MPQYFDFGIVYFELTDRLFYRSTLFCFVCNSLATKKKKLLPIVPCDEILTNAVKTFSK